MNAVSLGDTLRIDGVPGYFKVLEFRPNKVVLVKIDEHGKPIEFANAVGDFSIQLLELPRHGDGIAAPSHPDKGLRHGRSRD